jgi:hypothetical protein
MAADRTFRSLTALRGASTSRVLNLLAIGQLHADTPDFQKQPFFISPVLNSAILVKHRLRSDETDLFLQPRAIATKVIVPFEKTDLRSGGKSFMVGQRGFEEMLREVGNYGDSRAGAERDLRVLALIDNIPSLDPFLLREHLRCNEIVPHAQYFEISDADQKRMFDFAAQEIRRLTDMAGGGGGTGEATGRMVNALLSSEVDEKLEPLRATLQLGDAEFREGVFSWRGFLYYKWCLLEFWPALIKSLRQLKVIYPMGPVDTEQKAYITAARQTIIRGAKVGSDDIRNILSVYDHAYESLISKSDAKGFRDFLLSAPSMFLEIGEKMGALSHITSFWRYRFPDGAPKMVDAEELTAILQDFSKGFVTETPAIAA